jgi:hydroxymethylbilane synthase
MTASLRIGTRGSPLARLQTDMVCACLRAAHPGVETEVAVIRTSGDRVQDRTLAEIGGKGLFSKEIEQALLDRRIDLAVHSMKDMETFLHDGLCIGAVLPREDPRDALLSEKASALAELPSGAVVGTASIRRQAQILHSRPDLRVVPFRGNVETRIRKLGEEQADATLLAYAGLKRLGMTEVAAAVLDPADILPAAAQGAIGVEIRSNDDRVRGLVEPLDDHESAVCIAAERAMLAALDGSCHTPIGALAEIDGAMDTVTLQGLVARPDGSELHRKNRTAPVADAVAMATELGQELRSLIGEDFFA